MSAFPSINNLNIDERIEKLKPYKLGNHEFYINSSLGYYPYFSIELRQRVKKHMAVNCVVTGEGGVSKSYTTSDLCRTLSPKNFDVNDIVFRYPEFLRSVITSKRGTPIEFDEPSYAMSKKDWYKDIVKALVKTIESFRFKGKPLFIPIINKALLEKDIRTYLLQYQVAMKDRGRGTAYRLFASQFKDGKVYSYEICKLRYGLFDNNLCSKPSCLVCKKLNPDKKEKRCPIFRARYERKKILTQEDRYKIALEDSERQEHSKLSLDEIQAKAIDYFDKFYNPDKNIIDIDMLEIVLRRELKIYVGQNKRYRLAKQIKYDHPDLFEIPPEINVDTAHEKA